MNDIKRLLTDQINLKNAIENRCEKIMTEREKERESHKAFCENELQEKQKMLEHIGLLEQELGKIRGESELYKFENETLKSELSKMKVGFLRK